MYCANCGSKLVEGANFCTTCGTKTNSDSIGSARETNRTTNSQNGGKSISNNYYPKAASQVGDQIYDEFDGANVLLDTPKEKTNISSNSPSASSGLMAFSGFVIALLIIGGGASIAYGYYLNSTVDVDKAYDDFWYNGSLNLHPGNEYLSNGEIALIIAVVIAIIFYLSGKTQRK